MDPNNPAAVAKQKAADEKAAAEAASAAKLHAEEEVAHLRQQHRHQATARGR